MPALIAQAMWTTLRSRWRNGPMFPGWNFSYESTTRMLKSRAAAINKLPIADQRSIQDAGGDDAARGMAKKVTRTDAQIGGVPGEWFVPKGKNPKRVILYLHGGGFVVGSSHTHGDMIMRLALAADARIFTPNYRLAPEHKFPSQLDDCIEVYRGLLKTDGVFRERLVVAGDSAGGNLSITLGLRLRDEKLPMPAGIASLSPWVDLTNRTGTMITHEPFDWAVTGDFDWWVESYVGSGDPKRPLVSPMFADLQGLPPLRIEIGTAEMLLDQVRSFASKARDAGVSVDFREIPAMVHNCYILAGYFPECQAAIDDLGTWMKKVAAD